MGHLLIHLVESNWIPSDLMLGGFSVENVNDNSMANQSVGVVYDVQFYDVALPAAQVQWLCANPDKKLDIPESAKLGLLFSLGAWCLSENDEGPWSDRACVIPLRINLGAIGRAARPECKAPEACWVEALPTSGNAAIRPGCLSFGCMKSEGRGVPASVRHLDAVLMLRLALLRFSMHL